jgi:hypothetical protein
MSAIWLASKRITKRESNKFQVVTHEYLISFNCQAGSGALTLRLNSPEQPKEPQKTPLVSKDNDIEDVNVLTLIKSNSSINIEPYGNMGCIPTETIFKLSSLTKSSLHSKTPANLDEAHSLDCSKASGFARSTKNAQRQWTTLSR